METSYVVTDRPVEQFDQEVHEEHVQVAHHSGHVVQQAQEVDSAQDERSADTSRRRLTQPGRSASASVQQPPVHDPARPVPQPPRRSVRAAGTDQVHPLVGSVAQSARRTAGEFLWARIRHRRAARDSQPAHDPAAKHRQFQGSLGPITRARPEICFG